ncbi:MAG: hypothetical protein LBI14_05660 [Treponema sp.]|jgi:hypothetical protein|nr:hypothetical protein [Treponema sp.]
MNTAILIHTEDSEVKYTLSEQDAGITVKMPFTDHDGNGNTFINYNIVEVENGHKANVVKQFFIENNINIIRDNKAYSLEGVLFDAVSLPLKLEPNQIID